MSPWQELLLLAFSAVGAWSTINNFLERRARRKLEELKARSALEFTVSGHPSIVALIEEIRKEWDQHKRNEEEKRTLRAELIDRELQIIRDRYAELVESIGVIRGKQSEIASEQQDAIGKIEIEYRKGVSKLDNRIDGIFLILGRRDGELGTKD